MRELRRFGFLSSAVLAWVMYVSPAAAGSDAAVVLKAVSPVSDCDARASGQPLDPETERRLAGLRRELEGVVLDAVQDLGLTVDVSAPPESSASRLSERALIARAEKTWVISPRVELDGSHVVIRIVAVPPGGKVLFVRSEEVSPKDLEVCTVLMMRDLVSTAGAVGPAPLATPPAHEEAVVHEARSRGRAVFALNAAAFGGYVGFALQRAGGSTDSRLTYPLIALGAGIGLGASMIATEEWDVGVGDAWYLSAGIWWPLFGTLLVAHDEPSKRRFLYGAGAGAAGLVLSTAALTFGPVSEGGALIAHSGGAFGTVLGGIVDLAAQGRRDLSEVPTKGAGIGAITGVVVMGALARFVPPQPPSRILLIDLSAGLGTLTGAAVGSPLIFGDNVSETRDRLWWTTIALGTFVGAGIGLATSSNHGHDKTARLPPIWPTGGVIATISNPDGSATPVTGAGIAGLW